MAFFILLCIFCTFESINSLAFRNISESIEKYFDFEIQSQTQSFASTLRKVKRPSIYGEKCNTYFDCAFQRGLTCVNSTCVCASPHYIARIGNGHSQKITECVLRAGSPCRGDVMLKSIQRKLPSMLWTKIIKNIPFLGEEISNFVVNDDDGIDGEKCVDNARCIAGMCECKPNYFRDSRGLCLRTRSIGQKCDPNSDDSCRSSEGLHCLDGKCQCKMSMIYDEQLGKCLIPVGGTCDAYSSSSDFIFDCVRNAECSNDRCICRDSYMENQDGSCGVSHGNKCSFEEKCSDIQLTCRSGKCQCRYPIHQVFNETLGLCLSKPDGPCDPEDQDQNCIMFAECVKSQNSDEIFDYKCKCVQGYDEDPVGECVPSFQSECIEDEDCDQVSQLTCVNGKCTCPDEMLVWDRPRRKCVGVVGARCKYIQLERVLSMKMDLPTECVENAVCVEHVPVLDGRCECKDGFYFNKDVMKCI